MIDHLNPAMVIKHKARCNGSHASVRRLLLMLEKTKKKKKSRLGISPLAGVSSGLPRDRWTGNRRSESLARLPIGPRH